MKEYTSGIEAFTELYIKHCQSQFEKFLKKSIKPFDLVLTKNEYQKTQTVLLSRLKLGTRSNKKNLVTRVIASLRCFNPNWNCHGVSH